jgi:hypothetical protein
MKRINSLLLALLFISTTLIAQVNLKNGLVACYSFNGNANDESGNNNNGIVTGATLTTDRFGKVNSAYTFNGSSDYVDIPSGRLQNPTFSYSAWIKPNSLPQNGIAFFILSIGSDSGDQGIGLNNGYANGTDGFTGGGYLDVGENAFCQQGTLPNANQWYHVVVIRSTDKYFVYVDGVYICSTSILSKPPFYGTGTVQATIGSRWNKGQFSDCVIDDIYIYNRAITPEEVTALYQTTKSQTVDLKNGLVACYPLNGNAQDETKNGHNGTVNGATLTTDRFGKTNSAYSFDGNSFIQLANPNDFKNNSFTYSAWVNIPVEPSSASYLDAYSVLSIGNGQVMHFVNRPTEGLVWGFTTYNNENISYDINPSSTTNTTINTWHHFVITRSATQAKIYVDGVLIATATSTLPSTATYFSSNPAVVYQATIGTRPDENNIQFFNGSIDDVYIYTRVITPEEVTALYQGTKSTLCEGGVVACHPFSVVKKR